MRISDWSSDVCSSDLGVRSTRQFLDFGSVPATPAVAAVLDATTVLEVRRLNRADGHPFARVTVWCPEDLGAQLSRDDVERAPFYELLPVPLGGAVQTIGAALAGPEDAALLEIPIGSPVLRCERNTSDQHDRPVLLSENAFPGPRTEFAFNLPVAEPTPPPPRP